MKARSRRIEVKLPQAAFEALCSLVDRGLFSSRSEALRAGLYLLLGVHHAGGAADRLSPEPRRGSRLIRVVYVDADSNLREAVGWLASETLEAIQLVFDRPLSRGAGSGAPLQLAIPRPSVVKLAGLSGG